MKKILLVLSLLIFTVTFAGAQTRLVGVVKIANDENPLPGVTVSVLQQNFSTFTNASGEFVLTFLQPGDADVHFSRSGYLPQVVTVNLIEGQELDMGTIFLKVDVQEEARQEVLEEMIYI